MNRTNLMSVVAIALIALVASPALATSDVQLNLRYDDPNAESAGGTWDLLVKSDAANGVAGVRVVVDGITGVTGVDTANPGSMDANSDAFVNGDSVFRFQPFGGGTAIEIVAGDDLDGALVTGIGTAGSAANVGDDLYTAGCCTSATWADSSLIASGTFGATRPELLEVDAANGNLSPGSGISALANEFANPATDPVLAAAIGVTSVRGDGVATDGTIPGDANRDGVTDGLDFSILASPANFGLAGGWGQGNFNSDVNVDGLDFSILASPTNFGVSNSAPAVSGVAAVPEPTSLLLASLALVSLLSASRRRS